MWVKRTCQICNKEMTVLDSPTRKNRGKYCSRKCYELSKRGKPSWNKGLPAHWMLGNKYKIGKGNPNPHKMFGKDNHKWKEDKVGYKGLHQWVSRKLGKPMKCDHCNDTHKNRYHWANKSGKYLRNVSDWIRLCPKCHKRYDGYGT